MYYFSVVGDELKFLNNSDIRLKVLVDLVDGPLKIRDINRKSLLSYSSISSNIHKLCDEGYVEKIHNSFQLTNLGLIYITLLMDFRDVISTITDNSDFWLDHDISSLTIDDFDTFPPVTMTIHYFSETYDTAILRTREYMLPKPL